MSVILRACDFFDFAKIPPLKTNSLRAKKSRIFNKGTNSQDDKVCGVISAAAELRSA